MNFGVVKMTYSVQMILSVVIIIVGNVLTEIFHCWLYRSIAFGICGLLLIVHPVVPNYLETNKVTIGWTRVAGAVLILIGIFTRVHI